MKTEWKVILNYSSKEIILTETKVIIKDYFDPGKNPGIYRVSFEDFLTGRYKNEIIWDFGGSAYQEIIDAIHEKLSKHDRNLREY